MKRSTRSLLKTASRRDTGWVPPAMAEQAARKAADAAAAPAMVSAQSRADFSGVKVHTCGPLAEAAEDLGARAFAHGRDIAFAPGEFQPGHLPTQQLLAHELTHVAQQAEAGATALQFEPKKDTAGIGAAPPDESFLRDDGDWGAEDEHILFEKNDAMPDGPDEATMTAWAAQQTRPVYVHVHGYASQEGGNDYNLNLSAHRGVAAKRFLDALLPQGSKVFVFAHGHSNHFGAVEKNRRVGLSLIGPVDSGFKPNIGLGTGLDLSLGKKPAQGPFLNPPSAFPPALPPANTVATPPGPRVDPVTIPPTPAASPADGFKIDWRALNEPGTYHGVRMNERDVGAFETSGGVLYRNLQPLFGKDMASWWANRVVLKAYESRVTLENPNLLDLSDRDFKAHFPDATGIPPLPLLTPETLNFVVKHTFGKDLDFHFNVP